MKVLYIFLLVLLCLSIPVQAFADGKTADDPEDDWWDFGAIAILAGISFGLRFIIAKARSRSKTKDLIEKYSSEQPKDIPAANLNPSSKKAGISLEELKEINPIAYKRNIVAIAAGFRDFQSMLDANPSLKKAMKNRDSGDELNRIAAAYGYIDFESMFLQAERKYKNDS